MKETLISERIVPEKDSFNTRDMSGGSPGFPGQFTWRKREYVLDRVLETWRETSPCRHGADEQYVRKHWFRIATVNGPEMKIYFERQPRSGRELKKRWWLFTVLKKSAE